MAAPRYGTRIAGVKKLVSAILTSAGAGDAEKIVATNANGVLDDTLINAATTGASKTLKTLPDGTIDPSVLPSGTGADTASIEASEALSAGNFVNIWNDGGTSKVRKADAATEGKRADGFVLAAVSSGANATVYFEGRNTQLTGLTAGTTLYLSASAPGEAVATAPSTTGNVIQELGRAYSATAANIEIGEPVTLA